MRGFQTEEEHYKRVMARPGYRSLDKHDADARYYERVIDGARRRQQRHKTRRAIKARIQRRSMTENEHYRHVMARPSYQSLNKHDADARYLERVIGGAQRRQAAKYKYKKSPFEA